MWPYLLGSEISIWVSSCLLGSFSNPSAEQRYPYPFFRGVFPHCPSSTRVINIRLQPLEWNPQGRRNCSRPKKLWRRTAKKDHEDAGMGRGSRIKRLPRTASVEKRIWRPYAPVGVRRMMSHQVIHKTVSFLPFSSSSPRFVKLKTDASSWRDAFSDLIRPTLSRTVPYARCNKAEVQ